MTTTDTEFVQVDELFIEDLETLKVVADPLRLQIVEIMGEHPHTVKQVGQKLDLPASKLYYHINLLEKHGLISIASTRVVSGIVEKSYQTSAHQFRVKRGLLNPGSRSEDGDNAGIFVDAFLDNAKQDIKENVSAGLIDLSGEGSPFGLNISRNTARLTIEQAAQFQERLQELMKEFSHHSEGGANADQQSYAVMFAMYPTLRGSRPPESDDAPDDD